jgi:hypothetical protein
VEKMRAALHEDVALRVVLGVPGPDGIVELTADADLASLGPTVVSEEDRDTPATERPYGVERPA